jgi:hypothetical protein
MREDQKAELERIQAEAVGDTIVLVDAAVKCDIISKEGRGNKVWLYKAANQSMGIAEKIERFFTMRRTDKPLGANEPTPEMQAASLINQAKQQLEARKKNFS